jgi:aminodeoxyfutalosine deaminase
VILTAAWVLPVSGPPIRNGYLQIDGNRIAAIGPVTDLNRARASIRARASARSAPVLDPDELLDLGDAILTPGLVNCHTHLELTGYVGRIPPGPFWSWLPKLVELREAPGQLEREEQGVVDGAWQSLRAGVTCVGDISRRNLHWRRLKDIPLRKVCFVELLALANHPPRNIDELRTAAAAVVEDDLLTLGITPHAPYSVPGEQMCAALALAHELDRPWCVHWAETREECAFLRGDLAAFPDLLREVLAQCGVESPHSRPVEYLEQCVAKAAHSSVPGLLAHYNYPEPGDAERLAAAGHVVAYCPRAHRFFQHSPHPYRQLQRAGVRVALATDSAASNEDLSLLKEAQFVQRETTDPPDPAGLLRMMTLEPAQALFLGGLTGSLDVDKVADLAAFPAPPHLQDPVGYLVSSAPDPLGVWVAGRRVV